MGLPSSCLMHRGFQAFRLSVQQISRLSAKKQLYFQSFDAHKELWAAAVYIKSLFGSKVLVCSPF